LNLNPNNNGAGRGPWLIWTAVALAILLAHALSFRFVIDDAFISFRYAQNLVDGHGLVFNIGEKVEGYSNLLYVLLSAAGIRLGVDPLLWGRIWSTLAMGGLLALLPGIVRLLAPEENAHRALPGQVAQMLTAFTGAVACWMLAGLETAFFALFTVWAWRSALKRQTILAAVAGLLLILTRPEGPALAFLFAAWSLLPSDALSTGYYGSNRKRWLGPVLLLVGTVAFFLWRHSYFGWWLPNTYYAKTGDWAGQFKTGLPYGLNFLKWYGAGVLAVAVVAVLRGGMALIIRRDMLLTLATVVIWSLYVTMIGGDMLGMFRFFVPVLPLLLTWLTALLSGTSWLSRPRGALVATVILALLLLPASFKGKERRLVSIHMTEANLGGWFLAGDALAKIFPANTTIALGPAGYIPYITGFKTYDYYGLVVPEISHRDISFEHGYAGHEKHDGGYLLSRLPDLFLIGNVDITNGPRQGLIPILDREKDIVFDERFGRNYEMISIPAGGGKNLNLFKRRDKFNSGP
jgi:arabinofuranosyltransferase